MLISQITRRRLAISPLHLHFASAKWPEVPRQFHFKCTYTHALCTTLYKCCCFRVIFVYTLLISTRIVFSATEACKDNDDSCPRLAKNGECYSHYPWAEIMEKCPKSCHQCGKLFKIDFHCYINLKL